MKYTHVRLTEAETCPFCGTTVPAGASVCAACGAIHAYKPIKGAGVLFFVGGLFLGWKFWPSYAVVVALIMGVVGFLLALVAAPFSSEWFRFE